MVAPWLTFRTALRSRWRLWLGLALLIGTTTGGVMAGVAGARRMASAYERFRDEQHAADFLLLVSCDAQPEPPTSAPADLSCLDEIQSLPSVADLTIAEVPKAAIHTRDGRTVQPDPDPCWSGPGAVSLVGDRSNRFGSELNETRIVAGRRADPAVVDEVVVAKALADRVGLQPGSTVRVSTSECDTSGRVPLRTTRELHVVGIGVAPAEVQPLSGEFFQMIHVTPAYLAAESPTGPAADETFIPVRLRGGADIETFRREVAGTGAAVDQFADLDDMGAVIERSIGVQSAALLVGASLVALAGGAVLGQLLVRQGRGDAADQAVLGALGMSSRERFAVALLPAVFVAAIAGAWAVLVALVLSPLVPFNIARQIEPNTGLWVDPTVMVVGGIATFAFVLSVMVVVAWRVVRRSATSRPGGRRPASVVGQVARAGFPPTVVTGVQMALDRRSGGRSVPVWTSVSAMALAVFAITGSLTFGAGLTNILDTPRIAGVNWDAFFFHPIRSAADPTLIDRANLEEALADQPDITGFTAGTWWPVFPQGAPMELGPQRLAVAYLSFDAPSAIGPSVIRGRTPQTADEVLVGPETLDDLGLELGDTVEVHGQAGTWDEPGAETSLRARIVGVGVVPIVGGEARLGRGVTLTIDGLRRLNPETQPDGYWLRLAAGSDAATVVTEVLQAVKASRSFDGPAYFDQSMLIGMTSVQNIAQVARAPQLFAAVMGVLGLGVILHILANGLRAHRRDLAVLRALGFRRRDVDHAVAWQSIVYMFTALAVGVPLGVVVGRFALRLYAERLGVVPEPVIPWAQLGLLSAVAVAIAGTMGMALSRATSSANPAVALRAE